MRSLFALRLRYRPVSARGLVSSRLTMRATPHHSLEYNSIGKGGPEGAIALAEAFAKMPSLTSAK